jgi:ABC-type Fe3+-siderophore transport system permease subunit
VLYLQAFSPEQIYKIYQTYIKELSSRLVELNQEACASEDITAQVEKLTKEVVSGAAAAAAAAVGLLLLALHGMWLPCSFCCAACMAELVLSLAAVDVQREQSAVQSAALLKLAVNPELS